MTTPGTPTAAAISPDSGEHWSAEGAWPVAAGIHRIPLPLPMDGLRAVNVYVLETDTGVTLIDGGWAIDVARDLLERCLRDIGYRFTDIRRFLVTHSHRDHFTMASVLGGEFGAEVALGAGERPSLELIRGSSTRPTGFADLLLAAGAAELAADWAANRFEEPDPASWRLPDRWLQPDERIEVGERVLDAVHTPGHTPGHFVFADRDGGLMFAGDHVLPTITPSIGFVMPTPVDPLGEFMASLTKVRSLPDLRVLPAHGPVAPSTHARVDELLAHHEHRLELCADALDAGATTAFDVAQRVPWTRHERALDDLDGPNRGMAIMETKAHLDLLVARGRARTENAGEVQEYRPASTATG